MTTDYFDVAVRLANQVRAGRPQAPAVRHAIWSDTPPGRIVQACCGVLIHQDDAVRTPTCGACQVELDYFDLLAMEAE